MALTTVTNLKDDETPPITVTPPQPTENTASPTAAITKTVDTTASVVKEEPKIATETPAPQKSFGSEGDGNGFEFEDGWRPPGDPNYPPPNPEEPPVTPPVIPPVTPPVTPPPGGPTEDPTMDTDPVDDINPETGKPYDLSTEEGRTSAATAALQLGLNDPRAFLEAQGALQQYTPQEIDALGELMDPNKYAIPGSSAGDAATAEAFNATVTEGQTAEDVAVNDFEVSLMATEDLEKNYDKLMATQPMIAASMATEMDALLAGMEDGNVPLWARPAVTAVEQSLAKRGISASSIGRDSLFNAIIQSAMPIAQQDATFKQDANKTNYTAKVNALMSDTSAHNAALQFNATSTNQKNQFITQLSAQVDGQNAARSDAMEQFNSNADNQASMQFAAAQSSASQFNSAQVNDLAKFDADLASKRDQFNASMAAQIEQSNVQWRRQVNTQNTAGLNAVNQANAQNAFNLSNQATSFMWQEMRDQAQWAFQADQAEQDRRNQLEVSLLANETGAGKETGAAWESLVNNLIEGNNILGDITDLWGNWGGN